MPLVSSMELLKDAQRNQYAVASFNVENMEMLQAVILAAEEMKSPVIVSTNGGTLKYAPPCIYAGMVKGLAAKASIPVVLHLDHCSSYELALECIRQGYTSLMYDGSLLPYAENVAGTKRVVEAAGSLPVEGELGSVGGKEDEHDADAAAIYADPELAADFVHSTGISSLAPAIGTAHGIYHATPKLNFDCLSQIRNRVDVPLVLHGTSGVPEKDVQECIRRGICKINYATDLRIAFTDALRLFLKENPNAIDPKEYLVPCRKAVQKRVSELIALCGSAGKA